MDNLPEQATQFLYILFLMTPALAAFSVHNYLKNNKTAISTAVLSLPLTILVYQNFISNGTGFGGLIVAVLAVPIMYILLAPIFFLLVTAAHYLYVRFWG